MNTARRPAVEPELLDREDDVSSTVDASTIIAISKAEIDQQISTAKQYPRSVAEFIREATELVCLDEEIATACIYSLPRGKNDDGTKKFITGPSARFAELVAHCFGNNVAGGRVINESDKFVTAQGAFHDLQKNAKVVVEVQRRITDKYGKRFNEDMIGVTSNAAISIAIRNASLKGVPKPLWSKIYERARAVSIGDVTTVAARRMQAIEWFQKVGVDVAQILTALGVKGVEDIGLAQMETLAGLRSAIKDGTLSPEAAFAPEVDTSTGAVATADLGERVRAARQGKKPAPAAAPAAPQEPAGEPTVSVEDVRKRLQLAADKDALDEAYDLVREIPDGPEKDALHGLYETRALDLI